MQEVINYNAQNENEVDAWVRQTIKTLEYNYNNSMKNILSDIGYSKEAMCKKIPSKVWIAMVNKG